MGVAVMTITLDLSFLGMALVSLVGAAAGSYLSPYLKKRAENLATHADLDRLVEQMGAITERTKSIEAAISDDVWDRQKQWEMKRDTLFEVVRTLSGLDNALLELYNAYNAPIPAEDELKTAILENRSTKYTIWNEESVKFDCARFLAELVSGRKVDKALNECIIFMRAVSLKITRGEPAHYPETGIERLTKIDAIYVSIREELELEHGA
jgi:hypothetical protein